MVSNRYLNGSNPAHTFRCFLWSRACVTFYIAFQTVMHQIQLWALLDTKQMFCADVWYIILLVFKYQMILFLHPIWLLHVLLTAATTMILRRLAFDLTATQQCI